MKHFLLLITLCLFLAPPAYADEKSSGETMSFIEFKMLSENHVYRGNEKMIWKRYRAYIDRTSLDTHGAQISGVN